MLHGHKLAAFCIYMYTITPHLQFKSSSGSMSEKKLCPYGNDFNLAIVQLTKFNTEHNIIRNVSCVNVDCTLGSRKKSNKIVPFIVVVL